MNFLFTRYIYPIQKQEVLSSSLGIRLDNQRTEEEVLYIEEYLKNSHLNSPDPTFPPDSDEDIISLKYVLEKFETNCLSGDQYASEFFIQCKDESIYRRFARMWIIARYEDQGEFENLKSIHSEMIEEGKHGLIMLEDDHPIEKAKKNLVRYFSILSILCHSEVEDYYGSPILIDEEDSDMERHVPNSKIWNQYFVMFMAYAANKNWKKNSDWSFFPTVKDKISATAVKIEKAFSEEGPEKLLYIGSILAIVTSSSDDKVKIMFLTSIIEFLLTHNPDYNRFNVEDSINKQFQLKTSLLVYLNNKNLDLENIKSKLKIIYNLRSCIAHGNFKGIEKTLKKQPKQDGHEVDLSDFVVDLYKFIRSILEIKLDDLKLVKFLKDN